MRCCHLYEARPRARPLTLTSGSPLDLSYWHPEAKELARRPGTNGMSLPPAAESGSFPSKPHDLHKGTPWAHGTAANVRRLAAAESEGESRAVHAVSAVSPPRRRQKRPTLKPTAFPGVLMSDASQPRARTPGVQQLGRSTSGEVLHSLNLSERVVDTAQHNKHAVTASSRDGRRNNPPRTLAQLHQNQTKKRAAKPKPKEGAGKLAVFDPGF